MNLHYAHVIEVLATEGTRMGKIRAGGAIKTVSLDLLPAAHEGDEVLLCDGVAISRVENKVNGEEKNYVSGNSR